MTREEEIKYLSVASTVSIADIDLILTLHAGIKEKEGAYSLKDICDAREDIKEKYHPTKKKPAKKTAEKKVEPKALMDKAENPKPIKTKKVTYKDQMELGQMMFTDKRYEEAKEYFILANGLKPTLMAAERIKQCDQWIKSIKAMNETTEVSPFKEDPKEPTITKEEAVKIEEEVIAAKEPAINFEEAGVIEDDDEDDFVIPDM
jgi:hypothetical protein